jgi:hypothetical protein
MDDQNVLAYVRNFGKPKPVITKNGEPIEELFIKLAEEESRNKHSYIHGYKTRFLCGDVFMKEENANG